MQFAGYAYMQSHASSTEYMALSLDHFRPNVQGIRSFRLAYLDHEHLGSKNLIAKHEV